MSNQNENENFDNYECPPKEDPLFFVPEPGGNLLEKPWPYKRYNPVPGLKGIPVKDLDQPCDMRITIRTHVEFRKSNPQIDPDGEGMFRQDPVTNTCFITTGGWNHWIRQTLKEVYGCNLYIDKHVSLESQRADVAESLNINLKDFAAAEEEESKSEDAQDGDAEPEAATKEAKGKAKAKGKKSKKRMDESQRLTVVREILNVYPDLAMFGGPMTAPLDYIVSGAVQSSMPESYHAVVPMEVTVAPDHVQNDALKEKQDRNLGTQCFGLFALVHCTTTVFPIRTKRNYVSFRMINRLLHALQIMWKHHQSGQRPNVRVHRVDVFVHQSHLGDVSDIVLEKLTTPKVIGRAALEATPDPVSMADYDMNFDLSSLPNTTFHKVYLP